MKTSRRAFTLAALLLVHASGAVAQNSMVLKTAWVKKYADRATISAKMEVRHIKKGVNSTGSGGLDGDIHFSGVAPKDIGLPFVAEIVNAKQASQTADVKIVRAHAEGGPVLSLSGVWRLWFEHPAKKQVQGADNPFKPDDTNPSHSFELHPVNVVDGDSLNASFTMIPGYTAYTADKVFPAYDKKVCRFRKSGSGITINCAKVDYNYVEFDIEVSEAPKKISDGYTVMAKVLSGNGDEEPADGVRRMIFAGGSAGAKQIKGATIGDHFTVLGIPRINLHKVLDLVAKHSTEEFSAQLPYEMIVVGMK